MRISIIGGGIIGLSTAYWLSLQGCKVTLFEKNPSVGQGSSYANGGQLSYSYVAPLAQPDVWKEVPAWLLKTDSPLLFRPKFDWQLWRWLIKFLRACNSSTANQSAIDLLQLSFLSKEVLHNWIAHNHLDFGLLKNGKLIIHRDKKAFRKAIAQVQQLAEKGANQQILNTDELIDLEPSLAPIANQLVGAIYTPSEEAGDCYLLSKALFHLLEANPHFSSKLNTTVTDLTVSQGRVTSICTPFETIETDQVIVTNGTGSMSLLSKVGIKPYLYPLKGYSLSVPASASTPKISVTDYAQRIVYARLADQFRIAAMVDINGWDNIANLNRINLLRQQVKSSFPFIDVDKAHPWVGLRPATPKGKPIIGRSQHISNLWLNIGHGALGFTLACGSAALIGSQVLGLALPINPSPFYLEQN